MENKKLIRELAECHRPQYFDGKVKCRVCDKDWQDISGGWCSLWERSLTAKIVE